MLRIVIKDLVKVKVPENINLRSETSSSEPSRNYSYLIDLPEQQDSFGLSTLNDRNSARANLLDTIFNPANPPQEFIYLVRKNSNRNLTAKFLAVSRLAMFGFLIIILINFFNILNQGLFLRNQVIAHAENAYSSLIDAAAQAQNAQFKNAGDQFQSAQNDFNSALEQTSFLNTTLADQFGQEKNVAALQALLSAGKEVSAAGQLFSRIGLNFSTLPSEFINFNKENDNQIPLTTRLQSDLDLLNQSVAHLDNAHDLLSQVDSIFIPQNYQEKIAQVNATLQNLLTKLHQLQQFIPAILKLFGQNYHYRYLVLLQNDSEARATGGFIGSYLIMDLYQGRITRLDFHDVYDLDGQLTGEIQAPEEIAKITKNWGLRDSNYSPNFDISAAKAAWFLQQKGPSVDAVIAINQSFLKNLLDIYGPLNVKGLQKPLTAENYQLVLSYFIESKFFSTSNPKIVLDRTIEALKEKITREAELSRTRSGISSGQDYAALFRVLLSGIQNQKIMLYSRDADVQQLFDYFHLTPRQTDLAPENDYLQINSIGIGGNKSDQFIRQAVTHNTIIGDDGTLYDEIKIDRTDQFDSSYLSAWKRILNEFGVDKISVDDNVLNILGNSPNIDNIKVYLPLGAKLDNAVGIDPDQIAVRSDPELKKTFFLFPMTTNPGETSSVTIRYQLPYQFQLLPASIYRFTFQPQPGVISTTLEKTFQLGSTLKALKTYDSLGLPFDPANLKLDSDQNKELYLSAVIGS